MSQLRQDADTCGEKRPPGAIRLTNQVNTKEQHRESCQGSYIINNSKHLVKTVETAKSPPLSYFE